MILNVFVRYNFNSINLIFCMIYQHAIRVRIFQGDSLKFNAASYAFKEYGAEFKLCKSP